MTGRWRTIGRVCAMLGVSVGIPLAGLAQTVTQLPEPEKLAFVLPVLLDRAGYYAPALRPFLQGAISGNWISLNSSVAVELTNLPNTSPASAYRYFFDRQSGTIQRVRQSLGPVLAERPETIGKGNFDLAVTFQRFNFDRLDDLDLRGFQVETNIPILGLEAQLRASGTISLQLSQTTAHFAYGLTDKIDISYAFPMVSSSLTVRGSGTLDALGMRVVDMPTQNLGASATGLGDGVVRAKARLLTNNNASLAVAADLRLPIGDEFNYHGAGAYGIKPFVIASLNYKRVSPHVNLGYQWNGASYLGSQSATEKRRLPSQVLYAAGFDSGITGKVALAVDFLGQVVRGGQRTFLTASGDSEWPTISFLDANRHEYNAAVGIKALLREDLVLTGNLMFRLNNAGLRARVVPLIGLSYLF